MTEKSYRSLIKMQNQYEKVIEQNRQLQQERMVLLKEIKTLKSELAELIERNVLC